METPLIIPHSVASVLAMSLDAKGGPRAYRSLLARVSHEQRRDRATRIAAAVQLHALDYALEAIGKHLPTHL